jgi:hypothetical protein
VLVSRKRSASGSCSVRAWTAWKEAADLDDPGEVHGATDGGDDQIADSIIGEIIEDRSPDWRADVLPGMKPVPARDRQHKPGTSER